MADARRCSSRCSHTPATPIGRSSGKDARSDTSSYRTCCYSSMEVMEVEAGPAGPMATAAQAMDKAMAVVAMATAEKAMLMAAASVVA